MAPNTKYFANFYYKGDLFLYQEKFLQFNNKFSKVSGTKLEIFACKECQITAHIEEEEKRDENGCVYSIGWMDKRHNHKKACYSRWNRRDPEDPFHEFENQKNRKQVTQTDAAGATFSQTMAAGTNQGLVTSYAGNVSLGPARQQSSSSSVATSSGASQRANSADNRPSTSVNPRLRPKSRPSSAPAKQRSSSSTTRAPQPHNTTQRVDLQQLMDEEEAQSSSSEKEEKSGSSSAARMDSKGSTVKLGKKSYTVEKKLAEGGFAIVYLVCDKHGRNYALKRQLIRDDQRQVEACRTESQIVKDLKHKNIIEYVDHQLTGKDGVYDYMLLTIYYPENHVLDLMISRLFSNRWLTVQEILDIFCDVCEAVAKLHHSKTPVIHRDLKVENVLVDQRSGSNIYVLCDYGSATTKTLSKDTFPQIEEEIQRYTTLSYRAPEMIDLFSGVPIGTKSDIWALGILLYKLCYFSLPFGESPLAIQNGTYTFPEALSIPDVVEAARRKQGINTFPDAPSIPDELKAIMNLLLHVNARHRPNIFQASHLAFSAANRKCPVDNNENSRRIELADAVRILHLKDTLGAKYPRLFEKAFDEFENQGFAGATISQIMDPKADIKDEIVEPSFEEDPDVVDETASLGQECENPAEKQVNLRPIHRSNQSARESSAKD